MANKQLIYGLRPILQATQDGQTIDKVFLQKGLEAHFTLNWKEHYEIKA